MSNTSKKLFMKKLISFSFLFFLALPLHAGITAKSYVVGKGSTFANGDILVADATDPNAVKAVTAHASLGQVYGTASGMLTLPAGGYTLPAATNLALGGIKLAQAADASPASLVADTAGNNNKYRVKLDSNGIAYVRVPWYDTNSTYTAGTGINIDQYNVISATGSDLGYTDCSGEWTAQIAMNLDLIECQKSGRVVTVSFRFTPTYSVSMNCGNDWNTLCAGTFIYSYDGPGHIGRVNNNDPSRAENKGSIKICTFSSANSGGSITDMFEMGVMFLGQDPYYQDTDQGQGLFFRSGRDPYIGNTNPFDESHTVLVDCTFVISGATYESGERK